eukprot:TRINITY_DN1044_c0_g1_i2.p2 TRINITY_DN1044_c0_g1~~TRINITY_DN1044_c0_g1_i2.p2  ORF type:complete len:230 (+),score=43.98 TRINITY_DN1044_c0_g1_i2:52-741(+)
MKTAILFAFVALSASFAAAANVTWYIDVVLDDGATVRGSFVYDADANVFNHPTLGDVPNGAVYAANVQISGGSKGSPNILMTYGKSYFSPQPYPTQFMFSYEPIDGVSNFWLRTFRVSAPLTNAGGTVTIGHFSQTQNNGYDLWVQPTSVYRYTASGTISTTAQTTEQICAQQSNYGEVGYFCANGGFFLCVASSPSQSQYLPCPAGTSCQCGAGVECSLGGTQSPCTW